jgi:hypothetical protein
VATAATNEVALGELQDEELHTNASEEGESCERRMRLGRQPDGIVAAKSKSVESLLMLLLLLLPPPLTPLNIAGSLERSSETKSGI